MKRKIDVEGYKADCEFFESCPICFGCRAAYTRCSSKCDELCGTDRKKNICTSKLHYPANFERIIMRPSLDLDAFIGE